MHISIVGLGHNWFSKWLGAWTNAALFIEPREQTSAKFESTKAIEKYLSILFIYVYVQFRAYGKELWVVAVKQCILN